MVSVIVPVYKVPEYLDRCVESIRNQTYTDLEIILVDDGSPDDCPQMCDAYAKKDERIVVIHQSNGGLSAARNAGLKNCKGEYIIYVDSDDYIKDDMIETLVAGIENYDADIAISTYYLSVGEKQEALRLSGKVFVGKTEDMIEIIYSNGLWQAWAKLIKRDIALACPFIDRLIYEDYENTPRLLVHSSRIVVFMDGRYIYTVRNNSIMGERQKATSVDFARITKNTIELYNREPYRDNIKEFMLSFLFKQLVYNYHTTIRYDNSVNNEFLCESRKLLIQYRKEWMSSKAIGRGRKISYALIAYFPRIYRVAYLASHREKT